MRISIYSKINVVIVIGFLNTFLVGCSIMSVNQNDSTAVSKAVEVTQDNKTGMSHYQGPTISNSPKQNNNAEFQEMALYATKSAHGSIRYFLTLTDHYEGAWRIYIRAIDDAGQVFHASAVRNHVKCELFCEINDGLDIELTSEYMNQHKDKGITMRLYGPTQISSAPFTLSASYIKGFLQSGAFKAQ